jgi:hypothetical protein
VSIYLSFKKNDCSIYDHKDKRMIILLKKYLLPRDVRPFENLLFVMDFFEMIVHGERQHNLGLPAIS